MNRPDSPQDPNLTVRAVFPECPGCDQSLSTEGLALNEETSCPRCGAHLLLVRIDGIHMFLKDGWT
jgi:uncharacterized paraquat-inducible protein A